MNHPRGLPIAKSSRTSIARTTDRKTPPGKRASEFVFQHYAEDQEPDGLNLTPSLCGPASDAMHDVRHAWAQERSTRADHPALRDKRLLETLYEQVALQGNLETRDIRLNVRNGIVVIEGSVSDPAMKTEIASVVRKCGAVKNVINCIDTPGQNMPCD